MKKSVLKFTFSLFIVWFIYFNIFWFFGIEYGPAKNWDYIWNVPLFLVYIKMFFMYLYLFLKIPLKPSIEILSIFLIIILSMALYIIFDLKKIKIFVKRIMRKCRNLRKKEKGKNFSLRLDNLENRVNELEEEIKEYKNKIK